MALVALRTGPCLCGHAAPGLKKGEENVTSACPLFLPEVPKVWPEEVARPNPSELSPCFGPIRSERGSFFARELWWAGD